MKLCPPWLCDVSIGNSVERHDRLQDVDAVGRQLRRTRAIAVRSLTQIIERSLKSDELDVLGCNGSAVRSLGSRRRIEKLQNVQLVLDRSFGKEIKCDYPFSCDVLISLPGSDMKFLIIFTIDQISTIIILDTKRLARVLFITYFKSR